MRLTALLLVLSILPAHAADDAALMAFAAAQTGLPIPKKPPKIVYTTRCEIQRFRGQPCGEQGSWAAYDIDNRRILLTRPKNADPIWTSIRLHELVHHMQASAGVTGCVEQEAYRVQIAWLRKQGADLNRYEAFKPRALAKLTRC